MNAIGIESAQTVNTASHPPASLTTHPRDGQASAATPATPATPRANNQAALAKPLLVGWNYNVVASPRSRILDVEGSFPRGSAKTFSVGDGGEPYVQNVEVQVGGKWSRVPGQRGEWNISACAMGCRIRYRFELRAAAEASGERSVAELKGDAIQSPPSTWLLRPLHAPKGIPLRFQVESAAGDAFATGVYPVEGVPHTYEALTQAAIDLPYAVFGKLRQRSLLNGSVQVALLPGSFRDEAAIYSWIESSAKMVQAFYGRPPISRMMIMVRPVRGNDVGSGSTMGMSGAAIDIAVGERAMDTVLARDWVLVHEMIHTALPEVSRQHRWLEEGLATYVEPLVRVQAGVISEEEVWSEWIAKMHHGLPGPGDEGLNNTRAWGRTYWGGALFCLLSDVAIRQRTNNRFSLRDALRAIVKQGGNISVMWNIDRVIDVGDRATTVPVLREMYEGMGKRSQAVDLPKLWADLGVRKGRSGIVFDDSAPLSAVRRALVQRGAAP